MVSLTFPLAGLFCIGDVKMQERLEVGSHILLLKTAVPLELFDGIYDIDNIAPFKSH